MIRDTQNLSLVKSEIDSSFSVKTITLFSYFSGEMFFFAVFYFSGSRTKFDNGAERKIFGR